MTPTWPDCRRRAQGVVIGYEANGVRRAQRAMIEFVLIGMGIALVVAFAGWFGVGKYRTPAELRGDWWSRFEAKFRASATRPAGGPYPRERRPDAREEQPPR
jgi:hypothetical protein